MRDNPIHTFLQVLGGNIPDQLSLSGYRWFEVALYRVLLIGSLAIAYTTGGWMRPNAQARMSASMPYDPSVPASGISARYGSCRCRCLRASSIWLENKVKYRSFHAHASIRQVFRDHIALVQPVGRRLGVDNLLAKRLIPGPPYDGLGARAFALAS